MQPQPRTTPDAPLVLVAEDEPAIADTVLYALRSEGLRAEPGVGGHFSDST